MKCSVRFLCAGSWHLNSSNKTDHGKLFSFFLHSSNNNIPSAALCWFCRHTLRVYYIWNMAHAHISLSLGSESDLLWDKCALVWVRTISEGGRETGLINRTTCLSGTTQHNAAVYVWTAESPLVFFTWSCFHQSLFFSFLLCFLHFNHFGCIICSSHTNTSCCCEMRTSFFPFLHHFLFF